MLKKAGFLILILMMLFFIGGCGEQEEEPEEVAEEELEGAEDEEGDQEDKKNAENVEDKEDLKGEKDTSSDYEGEQVSPTVFFLEDMDFAWDSQIDFQANDLEDWLLTDDEIHFLYEKEAYLHYQSFDLNSGEELTKKKVEGAPTPEHFEIVRDISFTLHEFNDRVYGIIGQNDRITEERWDQLPEELQQEQRMMIIDLESDETLLSETPVIEKYTIPEMAVVSGTYFPGFIYDITVNGRYVMILHSFPGMSGWENHLNFSTWNDEAELEEANKEVLSRIADVPLWVYDLKEDELIEIPYRDEIKALVPHNVESLENGVNMIFTEQEGWLTLDIENKRVRKTGEGGTYRRTEPGAPGVEQHRSGTLFGENLFFSTVQESAEGVGTLPSYHYLWNFNDKDLRYLNVFNHHFNSQSFYFNHQTEEVVVNRSELKNEDQEDASWDEREYVEKLYRFSFDEEQVMQNQEDEPVESLKDLEGFEVVDLMEFRIGTLEEGQEQLSITGDGNRFARPIKDFSHKEYGVLAGSTLQRPDFISQSFFYAYRNDEGEEKIIEIDGADLIDATETHIFIFNDDRLRAYDIDEFFDGLEKK